MNWEDCHVSSLEWTAIVRQGRGTLAMLPMGGASPGYILGYMGVCSVLGGHEQCRGDYHPGSAQGGAHYICRSLDSSFPKRWLRPRCTQEDPLRCISSLLFLFLPLQLLPSHPQFLAKDDFESLISCLYWGLQPCFTISHGLVGARDQTQNCP